MQTFRSAVFAGLKARTTLQPHYARGGQRADLFHTTVLQHARTGFQRRAGRADIIYDDDDRD